MAVIDFETRTVNDVPAREATIVWGDAGVMVCAPSELRFVDGALHPCVGGLGAEGGAVDAAWRDADASARLGMLLAVFAQVVRDARIDAGVAHKAFLRIPEYRLSLPVAHPDVMFSDDDAARTADIPDYLIVEEYLPEDREDISCAVADYGQEVLVIRDFEGDWIFETQDGCRWGTFGSEEEVHGFLRALKRRTPPSHLMIDERHYG